MKIKPKWTVAACEAYARACSPGISPGVSYNGMCAALDAVAPLITREVVEACAALAETRADPVLPNAWNAAAESIARLIRAEMSSVLGEV